MLHFLLKLILTQDYVVRHHPCNNRDKHLPVPAAPKIWQAAFRRKAGAYKKLAPLQKRAVPKPVPYAGSCRRCGLFYGIPEIFLWQKQTEQAGKSLAVPKDRFAQSGSE